MTKTTKFCKITLLLSSVLFMSKLQAETPPLPPEEAVKACFTLNERDSCSFKHPQGTLEGICINIEEQLACAPKDSSGSGPNPPPKGVRFDTKSSTLLLPSVSVADELYFQVSLQLVSTEPVLFNLMEIVEIKKPEEVLVYYDTTQETLLVSRFNFDSKQYRLKLKLMDYEPDFQFELISFEEIN